jgi:hypothetical protein
MSAIDAHALVDAIIDSYRIHLTTSIPRRPSRDSPRMTSHYYLHRVLENSTITTLPTAINY